jgi:hypothetical protein
MCLLRMGPGTARVCLTKPKGVGCVHDPKQYLSKEKFTRCQLSLGYEWARSSEGMARIPKHIISEGYYFTFSQFLLKFYEGD